MSQPKRPGAGEPENIKIDKNVRVEISCPAPDAVLGPNFTALGSYFPGGYGGKTLEVHVSYPGTGVVSAILDAETETWEAPFTNVPEHGPDNLTAKLLADGVVQGDPATVTGVSVSGGVFDLSDITWEEPKPAVEESKRAVDTPRGGKRVRRLIVRVPPPRIGGHDAVCYLKKRGTIRAIGLLESGGGGSPWVYNFYWLQRAKNYELCVELWHPLHGLVHRHNQRLDLEKAAASGS